MRKKILIIVAHPDDAEIGMSMKIRSLTDEGDEVHIHCLSKGSSKIAAKREQEAREAGDILGISSYTFSNLPDTDFESNRLRIRDTLEKIVAQIDPDTIYTHYSQDNHLDHVITSQEALVAGRGVGNLIYFRSPYSKNFIPNYFFMGNDKYMQYKKNALDKFTSQNLVDTGLIAKFSAVVSYEYLHPFCIINTKLTSGINISDDIYTEAFIIDRIVEIPENARLSQSGKRIFSIKEKIKHAVGR